MRKYADITTLEGADGLPDERGFRLVYDLWLQAKRGNELPPVGAISPNAIPKSLLGDCSLMSIEDGPKRFYIRLVGTRIVEELGFDTSNTWGDDQPDAEDIIATCVKCVESRRPLYCNMSTAWAGNQFKQSRVLMLPYAGADGRVRRILSYIQFHYPRPEPGPDYLSSAGPARRRSVGSG